MQDNPDTRAAQLKAAIGQTCALLGTMHNKAFYMVSTCMTPNKAYCQLTVDSFRTYLGCYDERINGGGYVRGFGSGAPGNVTKTSAMQKSYEM